MELMYNNQYLSQKLYCRNNVDSNTAELVPNLGETWSVVQGVRETEDLAEKDFVRVQRRERTVEKPAKVGLTWNCKTVAQTGTSR